MLLSLSFAFCCVLPICEPASEPDRERRFRFLSCLERALPLKPSAVVASLYHNPVDFLDFFSVSLERDLDFDDETEESFSKRARRASLRRRLLVSELDRSLSLELVRVFVER